MAAITIGLPVFNGADLLEEALADIQAQTFTDFEVLIFDNASTDATGDIARRWAEQDARFRYFRNEENIGALRNFQAPLAMARSEWFMWHAHDDLSAPDYIERLHKLATSSPACGLAVGTIVTQDLDGGRRKEAPPPFAGGPQGTRMILRQLFGSHPSWFYGMWRKDVLERTLEPVLKNFPYAFASDHLTLLGPIIERQVFADPEAVFIQRYRRTAATPRRQTRMPSAVMFEVRRRFRAEARRIRAKSDISGGLAAALRATELAYLHHTLPSLTKMWRTRLREALGLATPREKSRHISADA